MHTLKFVLVLVFYCWYVTLHCHLDHSPVPDMTYNVFGVTLINLALSICLSWPQY